MQSLFASLGGTVDTESPSLTNDGQHSSASATRSTPVWAFGADERSEGERSRSESSVSAPSPFSDAATILHDAGDELEEESSDLARAKVLVAALSIAEAEIREKDATVLRLTDEVAQLRSAQEHERLESTTSKFSTAREITTLEISIQELNELRAQDQVEAISEMRSLKASLKELEEGHALEHQKVQTTAQKLESVMARSEHEAGAARIEQEESRRMIEHLTTSLQSLDRTAASEREVARATVEQLQTQAAEACEATVQAKAVAHAAATGLESAQAREREALDHLREARMQVDEAQARGDAMAAAGKAAAERAAEEALEVAGRHARVQMVEHKAAADQKAKGQCAEIAALMAARLVSSAISDHEIAQSRCEIAQLHAQLRDCRHAAALDAQANAAEEAELAAQLAAVRDEAAKDAAAHHVTSAKADLMQQQLAAAVAAERGRVEALTLQMMGAQRVAASLAKGLDLPCDLQCDLPPPSTSAASACRS